MGRQLRSAATCGPGSGLVPLRPGGPLRVPRNLLAAGHPPAPSHLSLSSLAASGRLRHLRCLDNSVPGHTSATGCSAGPRPTSRAQAGRLCPETTGGCLSAGPACARVILRPVPAPAAPSPATDFPGTISRAGLWRPTWVCISAATRPLKV